MKNYLANKRENGLDFFDAAFGDFFRPMFYDEKLDSMKTDIKETDTGYELEIEMPGFDKKDIDVNLENGYITVSAKKEEKTESEENGGRYLRKERSVTCQRSYYVGEKIREEDIRAKYDNGVLSLDVPKQEEKKPERKMITID